MNCNCNYILYSGQQCDCAPSVLFAVVRSDDDSDSTVIIIVVAVVVVVLLIVIVTGLIIFCIYQR